MKSIVIPDLPKGPLDETNGEKVLSNVRRRIGEVRSDLLREMEEKHRDRLPNWVVEAEKIAKRVGDEAKEIDGESTRLEKLIKDWTEAWNADTVKTMQLDLETSDRRMKKLRSLVDIHEALESLDTTEQRHKRDYSKRASLILALEGSLQSLLSLVATRKERSPTKKKEDLEEDKDDNNEGEFRIQESALKTLRDEMIVRKEGLTYDLYEEWGETFRWEVDKDGDNTNRFVINVEPRFEDVVASLRMIGLLEKKMDHLGKCLYNYLLHPLINDSGSSNLRFESPSAVADEESTSSTEIVLSKSTSADEEEQKSRKGLSDDVLDDCFKIFDVLREKTSADPTFAQQLVEGFVLDPLKQLIVESILKPAVPSDTAETPHFDRSLVACDGFLHKLKTIKLITDEESSSFEEFSANIDVLFLAKRCQHILDRSNRLISAELHNTVQVGGEPKVDDVSTLAKCLEIMKSRPVEKTDEEREKTPLRVDFDKPLPPLSEFPRCRVSESIVALLELVVKTLNESAHASKPLTAARLYHCARNMIESYLDVVAVRHEHQLRMTPHTTAIFYNNCYFLCHHLLTLGAMYESKLLAAFGVSSSVVKVTFVDLIPRLKELANEFMDAQVHAQTRYLIECLKPADGFNNMTEKKRVEICRKTIKACALQFQHISRVWRQVLPPVLLMKFQGMMAEELLKHIVKTVVALEDIAADDAQLMHEMFTGLLAEVESCFVVDKVSYAHRFCENSYYQFKEFLFVLNASLTEIEERWMFGPLADCMDALDVKQMMRALFQNTDKRAAVIAKIK